MIKNTILLMLISTFVFTGCSNAGVDNQSLLNTKLEYSQYHSRNNSVDARKNIANQKYAEIDVPIVSLEESPIEEIYISETSYGVKRTPSSEGPFPTVVFAHGGSTQYNIEQLSKFIQGPIPSILLANGYSVVYPTRISPTDPQSMDYINDIQYIIDELKTMDSVDNDNLVIMGMSVGGHIALQLAEENDFAAVILGEPGTIIYMNMMNKEYMESVGKAPYDISGTFNGVMAKVAENEGAQVYYTLEIKEFTRNEIAKIDSPMLMLSGDQHGLTPFNLEIFVPEVKAMSKDIKVVVFPDEQHGFYMAKNAAHPETPQKVADTILRFLKRHVAETTPVEVSEYKTFKIKPRK